MEFRSLEFDSLMECESIAASTHEILWSDDETLVGEQDIIRKDMYPPENSKKYGSLSDIGTVQGLQNLGKIARKCPTCTMPFDKGKKRRLIDNCGHERCYSCMFLNESCPLCHRRNKSTDITSHKSIELKSPEISPFAETICKRITKMKTNGSLQTDKIHPSANEGHPEKLPKTRPINPRILTDEGVMTRSCPTPPQSRKKFFLSPKALRSSFVQGRSGTSLETSRHLDAASSSSTDNRKWPSLVLNKIRSLWSAGTSSSNTGLNQLVKDEEDEQPLKPVVTKKSLEKDMYLRLDLLLGDGNRKSNCTQSRNHDRSLLTSPDISSIQSSNTSPVSTLTGSSGDHHQPNRNSYSICSLLSISGQSNSSSSPVTRRRCSVPAKQRGLEETSSTFQNEVINMGPSIDNDVSVESSIEVPNDSSTSSQFSLKPLFFEVPLQESNPIFIGRLWLMKDIEDNLASSNPGILLIGDQGTGKTALILQLVEYSCFGRKREARSEDEYCTIRSIRPQNIYHQIDTVSEKVKCLANNIVAYHFCQADNNSTCLVPDFIHSLASQLCQAPQLVAYRNLLMGKKNLQNVLTLTECIANPDRALINGILNPLIALKKNGKIKNSNYIILIDAICEGEYHRPDHGDTITSFLAKHHILFPPWLKIIATIRTHLQEISKQLPYTRISLDFASNSNDNIQKDLLNYINFRLQNSVTIQNNVTSTTSGKTESESVIQHKFSQHLLNLSKGSFLFVKLILDLLERGHLVAKSSGYKVLPVSLCQIYLLHFNLRFPTERTFEKVTRILSVCLAALYPLTLLEIYYSVNSVYVNKFLEWTEFLQCFKLLSGFLVKRLDNTYMFFHPSFREWLIRRDDQDHAKFLCDLREGHASIAFRLSRVQAPLCPEKTLELGHHILKAHVYRRIPLPLISSRDLQASWIAESSEDISESVCHIRNIYSPNIKVSRLLLLSGASPNCMTQFLENAPVLCVFAHNGIVPMVSLLLEFNADVELANSTGRTALSLASEKGHCDIVRQLIAAGANPGHSDRDSYCPLVHAARNGYLNIVSYLLACDWIVKYVEDIGFAPAVQHALIAAAGAGYLEIVEYLLDMAEVNVDTRDEKTGETALTIASTNGYHSICTALIARGASLLVTNDKDLTPLHLAVIEGHWAVTERLMQYHASIEQSDGNGKTPLMFASSEGHVGLIELLLDKGASINQDDNDGRSALSWALSRGQFVASQRLIERGANINQHDKQGRTLVDLAAQIGNLKTIEFLLDNGATIECVDLNGIRPIDRAIEYENIPIVNFFLQKGAKLGPATWAMAADKHDLMLILLNKLLEDGNLLYRKNRLKEAAYRYQYALKKFPKDEVKDNNKAFRQLHINFLLNFSRCKRKLGETTEALELANKVLVMKPGSYEAHYARAKTHLELNQLKQAFEDIKVAIELLPPKNTEVLKVLMYLKEDIHSKLLSNINENFQSLE